MPTTAMGMPTRAGSNIFMARISVRLAAPSAMASITRPAMTRLVEVPMTVHMPPNMEAKLSGM